MLSQKHWNLNPKPDIFKLSNLGDITKLRIFGDWKIEKIVEHESDLEGLSVSEVGNSREEGYIYFFPLFLYKECAQ